MSQTETTLLVVLGFSLAALLALFIGRFVWSLGLRLGARRMQKQVPSTLVGLQTERDRLRAEYAMLSQRMGSRLESIKLQMAEHMAEVTRHRNRLEMLSAEISAKDASLAAASSETASLRERISTLEVEAASGASDVLALRTEIGTRDAEIASLRASQIELQSNLLSGKPPEVIDWTPEATTSQDRLKRRIDELTSLSRSMSGNQQPLDVALASDPDPLMIEKLTEAARETADLQKELERLDAEWSKRLAEISPAPAVSNDDRPGAVANVVSLANRIRSLKKDIVN